MSAVLGNTVKYDNIRSFSLSPVKDTTVTVWQYPFPLRYLLLMRYVYCTQAGPFPLDNKSA
jgi:hypothetical protein